MTRQAPEFEDILQLVARLLHANGVAPGTMQRVFGQACQQLTNQPTAAPKRQHLRDLPLVISEWYSNPEYLDADGQPSALPLNGKRSLATLIERTLGGPRVPDALRKLQRNGVIRRRGTRYLLTDRRILYQDDDARSHGLEALRGLLRTLDRNLLDRDAPFRLFECIASNPTIPIDALARFDERVRSPAVEFLHSADTELTRLYGRRQPKEKTCRVGVGVFVFANAVHPTAKATARPARRRS
jgi:hypothetical protein